MERLDGKGVRHLIGQHIHDGLYTIGRGIAHPDDKDDGDDPLRGKLFPRPQSQVFAPFQAQIIVGKDPIAPKARVISSRGNRL